MAAVGLLLAGCGGQNAAASAPVVAPASASVVGSASAPVSGGTGALSPAATITNADQGKSFDVRVGQVVDVALKADEGMDNWQVAAPDPAVLAPTVHPAAAAARGVTLRAFKAVGAGSVRITATDRPTCTPGQACSQLIRGFSATVVVAA